MNLEKSADAPAAVAADTADANVAPGVGVGESPERVMELQCTIDELESSIEKKKERLAAQDVAVVSATEAAKAAARGINPKHLSEIRSMNVPPSTVKDVFQGVLTLLGERDTSWAAVKTALGSRTFTQRIVDLDITTIAPQDRASAQQVLLTKSNSFQPGVISQVSTAAAVMAAWVQATVDYNDAAEQGQRSAREILEGRRYLERLREELAEARSKLQGDTAVEGASTSDSNE